MEIAKPTAFWIASAPPTISRGLASADSAENCGESGATEAPQTSSSPSRTGAGRTAQNAPNPSAHPRLAIGLLD